MQQFHDIWEPVLKALSEQFSSTTMNLWFTPLELAAFSDTTAVIITESRIKKKIVINHYKEVLEKNFKDTLGFPVEVCILADEPEKIDREMLQYDVGKGCTADALTVKYGFEQENTDVPAQPAHTAEDRTATTASSEPAAVTAEAAAKAAPTVITGTEYYTGCANCGRWILRDEHAITVRRIRNGCDRYIYIDNGVAAGIRNIWRFAT